MSPAPEAALADARPDRPPPGALSALIADLARSPDMDVASAREGGLKPGDVVGRFEIVREVGRGGFGVVFEARDRELGRRVALKAVRFHIRPADSAREELLRREAEAVAHLQHPSIVTLYDLGRCDRGPFLVLEYLEGETLAQRLLRGPLAPQEVLRIAIAVARALAHAHAQGVLHRDLKPGNVFLTAAGDAKVLDFGLAHVFGARSSAGAGTPGYMAPEQLRGGSEDERSDLFALGLLIHEMATGKPWLGPDGARAGGTPATGVVAPAALARLVAELVEEDPARRPSRAEAALERLLQVQARLGPRKAPWQAIAWGAVVGAVALGVALALASRLARPSPPPRVAVAADVVNTTGDPDLDDLSALLITALEPSRTLRPVPRGRVIDALRAAGKGDVARIDEATARETARRLGASALLLVRVHREGEVHTVELDSRDVEHGAAIVAPLRETAFGKAEVPDRVERLARAARRALGESDAELGVAPARGEAVSIEAYHHYFLGDECAARPVHGQDCAQEFRRAIALDPSFAAAHYQLAVWDHIFGGTSQERSAALAAAVKHAGKAPEKERLLIDAWAAHEAKRDEDAIELYRRIAARWPDDKQAFYMAADLLLHRDEPRDALPWFEDVLKLDPSHGWSVEHLADWLGALGRRAELERWVERWRAAPSPAALHGLSRASGWLGDVHGAIEAARQSAMMGGGAEALEDLGFAMVFAGEYAAAQSQAGAIAQPGSAVPRMGFYGMAALEAYQGRPRAGFAWLEELRRRAPALDDSNSRSIRADYVLGARDAGALWAEVEVLRRMEPAMAAEHAVGLAWLGDTAHAEELASALRPGSVQARTYEALALWNRGERDVALDRLRQVSETDPLVLWRVAPVYLYGELLAEAGRDAEAIEALRRFQALYIPRMMWRSWAYPRSVYLSARAHERLGQRDEALRAVNLLLARWSKAEADAPLLAEAQRLRARLR